MAAENKFELGQAKFTPVTPAQRVVQFAAHDPVKRAGRPKDRRVGLFTRAVQWLALWAGLGLLPTATQPAQAEDFPELYNSEPDATTLLTPQQALEKIVLPERFRAELFAHEPDVQNPIGMSFDHRGRLWVAENYTYAERGVRFDLNLRDRVIILADEDGDGRAESRKVFTDDVQMLTGLVVDTDGVWLMCPPKLLFIPDRDGDDRPDGPAQEVLDGFTVAQENYHNFANGLKFGPDGWLYGRCGASCPGEVGLPGTPPEERIPLRGGLWRYHPKRQIFEPLTQGTTNPWGHDWNAVGEPFFINTVNGHLWHAITGAHFVRPHSLDSNPRTYELIDQHADHWHFDTGKSWTDSRGGAANSYGGGHAHIGCMIYQGDAWPEAYRGKLMTLNMHGRRINVERLEREGSGYVGRHEPDMILFEDPWFRGIDLDYGPDGNVWVLDWSDTGECHEANGVHRTSGRIYKLCYGPRRPATHVNLEEATNDELAKLHRHPNQWFVRHARCVLNSRALAGADCQVAIEILETQFETAESSQQRLDALWTLHLLRTARSGEAGGADDARSEFRRLRGLLVDDRDEYVRSAAVGLLTEFEPLDTCRGERPRRPSWPPSSSSSPASSSANGSRGPAEKDNSQVTRQDLLQVLALAADSEQSSAVRLALASAMQRLPIAVRPRLAAALASHAEDRDDHNLPLMIWYGLIPVADRDPQALVEVFQRAQLPTTRRLIARRLGEGIEAAPAALERLLTIARSESAEDVVAGLSTALAGWRKPPKPSNWDAFAQQFSSSTDAGLLERLRQLSALLGDGRSLEELRQLAKDNKAEMTVRLSALQSLVDVRAEGISDLCAQLLSTRYLNSVAIQGVARESAPELGEKIVKAYRTFAPLDRPAVIATLCTRPAWGRALLAAIESGQIPKGDLNANHARQLTTLGDAEITERLARVWGQLRESPADKLQAIEQLKSRLTPRHLASADPTAGKAVFTKVCGNCHRLYGEGGKIGPDLTGAQRQNLDYLLQNIIDPSAVVTADFSMSTVLTTDGRVLSGVVTERTPQRIVLQMQNELLTLSADELEQVQASKASLMPDALLQTLSSAEVDNLFAYLMSRTRVE